MVEKPGLSELEQEEVAARCLFLVHEHQTGFLPELGSRMVERGVTKEGKRFGREDYTAMVAGLCVERREEVESWQAG